ncbi:VOC family protein [Aliiglaciecola sp. M165]|uniref:VOC family protein n=1 Tax=Aliiglaciecola sp. M165 TaxID=2593649 RepID=UPI00117F92A7|nr:VOC family protein [Aliiglaciecola sp. M165]TRY32623.1 VOC family protein [Aliiglaciecola sp. M165]
MSDGQVGSVVWTDITVENASGLKDFYQQVVGWKVNPVSMGDYEDYSMQLPGNGQDTVGICHARGGNADLPSQWLLYFKVANLDESLEAVENMGGKTVSSMKTYGGESRYIIIQDPAGAVCALFEDNSGSS